MTRAAQQYRRETENLLRYYQDRDSPVLDYIKVTDKYVAEMEGRGFLDMLDEIEYNELFTGILCLIGKHYAPSQFLSVVRSGYVRSFSPEFMGYILSCRRQFKRKPTWSEICDLSYAYDAWRIKWLLSCHFRGDSLEYATKNISLKDLWKFGG